MFRLKTFRLIASSARLTTSAFALAIAISSSSFATDMKTPEGGSDRAAVEIGSGAVVAPAADTVLTASSWAPPGHLLHEGLAQWCDALHRRGSGLLRCDLLPTPVVRVEETFDAVQRAAVDIGIVAHGLEPQRYAAVRLGELPMLAESAEAVSVVLQRVWTERLAVLDEHRGTHVLAVFTQLPAQLFMHDRRVRSTADLTGTTVRSGGGVNEQVINALRALRVTDRPAPIHAITNDVADHLLSGALLGFDSVVRYGLTETFPHAWTIPGGFSRPSFSLVINDEVWRRLSDGQRRLLDEVGGEQAARLFGQAADLLDRSLALQSADAGVRVEAASRADVANLKSLLEPVAVDWAAMIGSRGVVAPEKLLSEFRVRVAREQSKVDSRRR